MALYLSNLLANSDNRYVYQFEKLLLEYVPVNRWSLLIYSRGLIKRTLPSNLIYLLTSDILVEIVIYYPP